MVVRDLARDCRPGTPVNRAPTVQVSTSQPSSAPGSFHQLLVATTGRGRPRRSATRLPLLVHRPLGASSTRPLLFSAHPPRCNSHLQGQKVTHFLQFQWHEVCKTIACYSFLAHSMISCCPSETACKHPLLMCFLSLSEVLSEWISSCAYLLSADRAGIDLIFCFCLRSFAM